MTLETFRDRLEQHDWYFAMSDDHRSYTQGRKNAQELRAIAAESPEHQALYDEYAAKVAAWAGSPAALTSSPRGAGRS